VICVGDSFCRIREQAIGGGAKAIAQDWQHKLDPLGGLVLA
jgi:hypothetical protein